MSAVENDKEAEINERIEKMRKRNEEIRRRHMEVEADKQNADIFSSTAPPSAPKPKSIAPPKPARERPAPVPRPRNQDKSLSRPDEQLPKPNTGKIYSNFAEGKGPPPDPGYSFLADDERDAPKVEVKPNPNDPEKSASKKVTREKSSKFSSKSRGRRQDQRPQRAPQKGQSSNKGNPGEEKWRAERAAIDEARIQRQKTAAGSWRREWDVEKIDDELEDGARLNTQGGHGMQRSPPKQWDDRQTPRDYRGRGRNDRGQFNYDFMNNDNVGPITRGGQRMQSVCGTSPDSQDNDSTFQTSYSQRIKPSSISILRRPMSEGSTKGSSSELVNKPSENILKNGGDLRDLLRSKSNDTTEITSVKRNAPERRSFGSGRVSHHYMESPPTRGSQSEEESDSRKSNPYEDTSCSLDMTNLKIMLPSEGSRVAKVYMDRPTPRPLHSQTKQNLDQEITSLAQRENPKSKAEKPGYEPSGVPNKRRSKVDEGEESWEDCSDKE